MVHATVPHWATHASPVTLARQATARLTCVTPVPIFLVPSIYLSSQVRAVDLNRAHP